MHNIKSFYKNATIFLLFVILIAVFTYPLVFKISSFMPGFENTDEPYWSLWFIWWLKYSFTHGLNMESIPLISAPFGLNFGSILYPAWDFVSR